MIGNGKTVLKYFWVVVDGRLHGRGGIQVKNYKYAEVSQMEIEWHERVQVQVVAQAKVRA